MKKLLSLFLAVTLALALAPCAFADNGDNAFALQGPALQIYSCLKESYGEKNTDVLYDDEKIVVFISIDGFSASLDEYSNSSGQKNKALMDSTKSNFIALSQLFSAFVSNAGFPDAHVYLYLKDDRNEDNTILALLDGELKYDLIEDSSSPDSVPTATGVPVEEPTERVSALEFCELYTKRLMEFNSEYSQNMGGLGTDITDIFFTYDRGDTYRASCSGGTLTVNKTDLTIESLMGTLMDLDAEEQEAHNIVLNALIIISALEMDDLDARALQVEHAINPSQPENVFMKFLLEEYTNIIHPALSSNADKLDAGEAVLIYQGNYDYYAVYKKDDPVLENCIYLFAEARG